MKESDLAKPVADWLREKGYVVYSEQPLYFRCVDLVGLKEDEIICIELKKSLTQYVIRQAYSCQIVTNNVYVAVGTKPRQPSIEKCRERGIGILSVKGNVTEILKPSYKNNYCNRLYQKILINRCLEFGPSDEAGKPIQKGVGSAQDCCRRIKKYLISNSNITWKEIYENVPNHYCSYKSMQNAMRQWCSFTLKQTNQL